MTDIEQLVQLYKGLIWMIHEMKELNDSVVETKRIVEQWGSIAAGSYDMWRKILEKHDLT